MVIEECNTEAWDDAEYLYIKNNSKIYSSNIVRGRYTDDNEISPHVLNGIFLYILKKRLLDFQLKVNNMNYKWNIKILREFIGYCLRRNIQEILNRKQYVQLLYKKIINIIQIKSDVAIERQLKKRTDGIKYSVGVIVQYYTQDSYDIDLYDNSENHCGMIIGWDYEYDQKFRKKLMMGRNTNKEFPYLWTKYADDDCIFDEFLGSDKNQPHYIILTENKGICYVLQDRISICPPREIDNIEIGRYFYRFVNTHYVPNKSLEENYPSDTASIFEILFNH